MRHYKERMPDMFTQLLTLPEEILPLVINSADLSTVICVLDFMNNMKVSSPTRMEYLRNYVESHVKKEIG